MREFDERVPKKNLKEVVRLFRRAECLHTLIDIYHELEEGESAPHGRSRHEEWGEISSACS